MAKVSAKGAVITVATTNISSFVTDYEIEWAQDMTDVTGFTDGWHNFIGGMPVVGLTLTVLWEKTAGTGTLAKFMTLMGTPATCSIVPESGGQTLSGTFICDGIHPGGAAGSGAISLGSVHLSASGSSIATFA
jgi:hypothetical protein